ncbi:MAG: phosphate ABC transporter ATP-binding protein [Mycobacteriaceae bacterium]|nr:phosphate ABC transporter ATP-binding protein [Mycobacteriaceae bacterium]
MNALLSFDDVVVERDGVRALDGFSAAVPEGGVTAVFGPSGAGKSTLLRICNRLDIPTAGRVLFGGDDIAGLNPLRLRRRVGMCFQRPTPFPGTVADNLRVAEPRATEAQMEDVLALMALTGSWLDRDATALSGGEAQRICLARTLITRPHVLLLDEPTASVDAVAARAIEQAVRQLADGGITALWVSHDPAQVQRIADRVLRIEQGRSLGIQPVTTDPDTGQVPR